MSFLSVPMMMRFIRQFGFLILMREHILHCESVRFKESIFTERSEEFVLLNVGVTSIGLLRVDSGEVLPLQHILQLEGRVSQESGNVEVEGGRLEVVIVLENPEFVNGVEHIE